MSEPLNDKAQVSIDFPQKFYMGSFGCESRFDVTADKEGVHIHLDRPGEERRHVGFHLHHRTVAGILQSMADALSDVDDIDKELRKSLREAATYLAEHITPED